MEKEKIFDATQYYSNYPQKVIARPGHPARAAFKSTLIFNLFAKHIYANIDNINTYADIGACFGFGTNAIGYHIRKKQGFMPKRFAYA
jgi:hypothetical protein